MVFRLKLLEELLDGMQLVFDIKSINLSSYGINTTVDIIKKVNYSFSLLSQHKKEFLSSGRKSGTGV